MEYPIGSTAAEGIANGATPFVEDDRYTSGFAMARERGVPNVPRLISSLPEDQKLFGGHITGAYGSYIIEQLFRNAGQFGAQYFGVRVLDTDNSDAASIAMQHGLGTGLPTLTEQNAVAPSATQYASRLYSFSNVNVGDQFSIGGVSVQATIASPEHVAILMVNALRANAGIDSTYYIGYNGSVVYLTHKTINTAIAVYSSVTPANAPAVTTPETLATGTITMTTLGSNGDTQQVIHNGVNLGTYTKGAGETTVAQEATAAAAVIQAGTGTHGYTAAAVGAVITITAPVGSGDTLNGLDFTINRTGTMAGYSANELASTAGTSATDTLTVDAVGANGVVWKVQVASSIPGVWTDVGYFPKTSSETTTTLLATAIRDAVNGSTSINGGFTATASGAVITLKSPAATGANWNGKALRLIKAAILVDTGIFGNVISGVNAIVVTGTDFTGGVTEIQILSPIATDLFDVVAAQRGQRDPGTWGNQLSVKVHPYGSLQVGNFTFEVFYKGQRVEQWSGNTISGIIALVNSNSDYVLIENYNDGQGPTGAIVTGVLSGGSYTAAANEAAFYPVSSDTAPKSLGALDGLKLSIVAQTEYFTNTIASQVRDYAQRTRRCGVSVLPYLAGDTVKQGFSDMLQTGASVSAHIAAYNLWGEWSDGNGGWIWTPCLGAIIGAGYIRIPKLNNDQIWYAPAGVDSVLLGFRNFSPAALSQAQIDDMVRNKTINVAVTRTGKGTYLDSSRTMSTHSLFMSVHIRRLTNYLLNVLEEQYEKVLQKPNTPELRALIKGEITQYFRSLYSDGALERTIPFEKAFQVICDTTNNPLSGDRKQLTVDIYWIPTECIEAIRLNLNRNDGTLIASVADLENAA